MGLLPHFLPAEVLPLVLVLGAGAVMLGLVRPSAVVGFVVLIALMPVVGAIAGSLVDLLPWPIHVLVFGLIGLAMVRAVLSLAIGSRAADGAVGRLAYDLIRLPFLAVVGLLRLAFRRRH
jgi:hypothetical protein